MKSRRRDADATRSTLLETAGAVFAEKGFDGARVDEIAGRAGVNKRMIYAYFGDKDGLYRAVLDAHLSQALALAGEGEPAGEPPREQAERIIRRYFEFLSDHPDFVRLLSWEALSRERRGRRLLLERLGTGLEPLHAVVRRGVAQGAFRADLAPRSFIMGVNAFLLGYFNQRSLVEALWRTDLDTPRAREGVLRDFLHLLLDGIGARP